MSLTCRDIIKRAARMNGAIATGDDPEADELADAFVALNTMTRALHGDVIGPRLTSLSMAATMQAENAGLYQAALAAAATLTAPLKPRNGSRFGIVDVNANFSTYNATIARNNQLLEGAAANIALATNGSQRVWFFDADTGNWVREADLSSVDVSPPYPDRLLAFLPAMLAVFVGPEIGGEIRPDVVSAASLGMQSFAKNYGRRGRNGLDGAIGAGGAQRTA
jgi:hypothetical protein